MSEILIRKNGQNPEIKEDFEAMVERFNGDYKLMFNYALSLLETYYRHLDNGEMICAVNDSNESRQEIRLPEIPSNE